MEEQLSLLDKYLQLYDSKKYQEKFYEFSYHEILCHFIECKIYKHNEGKLPDRHMINKEFGKVISKTEDLKLKIKLMPLILFLGEEYWKYFMKMNFFDDIHLTLLDDFKSLSFKINFNKRNELSYTYESQQDMIKGIENKDFKTIACFDINPTMGNYQYNHFIYFVANRFFFDEYCQALDKKDDFTFLLLLIGLKYDEKEGFNKILKISNYISKNKTILQIKLLEDILPHSDDEENEDFICKAIMDFSINLELWQQFISFYLEYPSRYPRLFKPLSKAIVQLNEKNINLLLHGIRINKFTSNESQKALVNCFLNIKNNDVQKYCLETLSIRWINFIDSYSDYFGRIVLTDITDLAIVYISEFQDKNVIIQEVELILSNLEEIDNKWFVNRLEYSNYFYKLMTKLFVYGFAVKKHNLYILKERISFICSKSPVLKHENGYHNKTTSQLFQEYII